MEQGEKLAIKLLDVYHWNTRVKITVKPSCAKSLRLCGGLLAKVTTRAMALSSKTLLHDFSRFYNPIQSQTLDFIYTQAVIHPKRLLQLIDPLF